MKEITLKIPDSNFPFFMEIVNKLGIEVQDFIIPEKHKEIVRERMKKSKENPDRLLDWDTIKDQFEV